MTELENIVIKPIVDTGTIKFYGRYIDDTRVVVKSNDVLKIHEYSINSMKASSSPLTPSITKSKYLSS